MFSNQKSNYPEMLGQIGLAFGCVNYLSTPETSGTKTSPSRQKIHPETGDKLAVRKASPEERTPSPGDTIAPKISLLLAKECTPAESRPMTLYGYNAAARLPFAFSHARRSLRAAAAPAGRMVRSASSGARAPLVARTGPHARTRATAHRPRDDLCSRLHLRYIGSFLRPKFKYQL